MSRVIDFFFDYISHNAYLAWTQLEALANAEGCRVRPIPVLFAGMLNHYGQMGPAEIRPKAVWMMRDVYRKAKRLGVPFAPPASHPFRPLTALRVTALPDVEPRQKEVIDALFAAAWARGMELSDDAVVASVLDALGFDGMRLVARSKDPATKSALRDATDAAIARGVFGVPSMMVGDALFFGFDDFDHLRDFLRGDDPAEREDFSPWLEVKPSAVRQR